MTELYMPNLPETPTPTLHDVATALGMHKSTVSLGLSGKGTVSAATREKILKVATEMGYQPNPVAQRLAQSGNNQLVYLCSSGLDVGLGTEKILLIQKRLRRLKLEVPIYSLSESGEEQEISQVQEIRDLCRQKPRAIVYSTQGWQPAVLLELQRFQQNGGVVVCYDLPVPLACDQVVFDREHNTYESARYLIERGHRKLGINLSPPNSEPDATTNHQANSRLAGFRRALEEAGLGVNDQWFFKPGGYEKGGQEMAAHFLAMPAQHRPTGLCIVNDYSALAFMSELLEAGIKIPDDVIILGHDNQPVARYCPIPLTSATQPVEEVAQAVVDLMVARLDGNKAEPRTLTIRGELVERKSVTSVGSNQ